MTDTQHILNILKETVANLESVAEQAERNAKRARERLEELLIELEEEDDD